MVHLKKVKKGKEEFLFLLLNADAMFNNFLGVGRIDKEIKPVDISPDIAAKAFAEQITEPPADLENVEN